MKPVHGWLPYVWLVIRADHGQTYLGLPVGGGTELGRLATDPENGAGPWPFLDKAASTSLIFSSPCCLGHKGPAVVGKRGNSGWVGVEGTYANTADSAPPLGSSLPP